jgi:hypothetical protein
VAANGTEVTTPQIPKEYELSFRLRNLGSILGGGGKMTQRKVGQVRGGSVSSK